MKKCPFCDTENYKEQYICENCGSFMGNNYSPPELSSKAKELIQKQGKLPKKTISKPVKPKKTRLPEYVKLYHGPLVKRSTYNWMKKRDENGVWLVIGIALFIALVKGCN